MGEISDAIADYLIITTDNPRFESAENIANEIRLRVKTEIGLTISVGVSFNKVFAKLGSDIKKPDAVTVIDDKNYKKIVWKLPVEDLLYVGRATKRKLNTLGIHTIGDLAKTDKKIISDILGGGKILLIGKVIEQKFKMANDWNAGCGLSLVLMVFIFICMAIVQKYDKDSEGTSVW